jgi:DeoR/GlpR family transcriptional regulator of sugar metabolism
LAGQIAPPEPPVLQRSKDQLDLKARIGQKAAELVRDGDTIYLGSGTTVLEIAKNLGERKQLTIITNSLLVLNELADVEEQTLIGLGGLLRKSEHSLIGHITEAALAELRADRVFMGVRGVHLEYGLTNDYLPETMTDRAIIKAGREVILVVDHTKLGQVAASFVDAITAVDLIITDDQAPEEMVVSLRDLGIKILLA